MSNTNMSGNSGLSSEITTSIKRQLTKEFNKKLRQEKKNIVNKIIELYPHMEEHKKYIMNNLHQKKNNNNNKRRRNEKYNDKQEIVVEQVEYNNKVYYKDEFDGILNGKAELVGSSQGNEIRLFQNNKKKLNQKKLCKN